MLVQMPEIIYVSEFYVEQFIWTEIFTLCQIVDSAMIKLQVKTGLLT